MSDSTAATVLALELATDHHQGRRYPGLVHVRTQHWDKRRWSSTWLDVYLHVKSDTYVGVLFKTAATEMQECDTDAEIVPVEVDPTPHYRIKRSTS